MRSSMILENLANLVLITLIVGYSAFLFTGIPSVVVIRGSSMEPSLYEGDVVYIVPKSSDKIVVGDIVVFRAQKTYLVHRVVAIEYGENTQEFITKGDSHPRTDQDYGLSPVREQDIVGTLLSLDNNPIAIPRVGLIYTFGYDFIQYWTQGKVFLLLPCIILAAVLVAVTSKKTDRLNKYPFSRSIVTKKMIALIIIFCITIVQLASIPVANFRIYSFTLALGVNAPSLQTVDYNLGSLHVGQAKNITVSLYALSTLKVSSSGLVYIDGNITQLIMLEEDIITITPEKRNRINLFAYAPLDSENGLYHGKLWVYSRPEWSLIPSLETIKYSPNNLQEFYVIDFISNLIIAVGLIFFQFLYLLVSNRLADAIIWNYGNFDWLGNRIISSSSRIQNRIGSILYIEKARLKLKRIRSTIRDFLGETVNISFSSTLIVLLLCLPCLFGHLLVGLLLSTILPSLYTILVKKQTWRQDTAMLAVESSLFSSILYLVQTSIMFTPPVTFLNLFAYLAPISFLALISFAAALVCTYLTTCISLLWIGRTPEKSLNILGDWNIAA